MNRRGPPVLTDAESAAVFAGCSRTERVIARAVLSFWFPVVLLVCVYLLGSRVITMPTPARDASERAAPPPARVTRR